MDFYLVIKVPAKMDLGLPLCEHSNFQDSGDTATIGTIVVQPHSAAIVTTRLRENATIPTTVLPCNDAIIVTAKITVTTIQTTVLPIIAQLEPGLSKTMVAHEPFISLCCIITTTATTKTMVSVQPFRLMCCSVLIQLYCLSRHWWQSHPSNHCVATLVTRKQWLLCNSSNHCCNHSDWEDNGYLATIQTIVLQP